MYVREGEDRPARVLLDPNTLSADGQSALSVSEPSTEWPFFGYAVSTSGSDWQEIRVRNVETGRDARDTLKWVKFSGISWTRDNKGFFYNGYEPQTAGNTLTNVNRAQRVYYHRVGAPQSADQITLRPEGQAGLAVRYRRSRTTARMRSSPNMKAPMCARDSTTSSSTTRRSLSVELRPSFA